jgi:hypothetical protein
MKLYRIKDWERWYEVSDSKKVEGGLTWVAIRTKQDGFGFRRIASQRNACELFAAWVLMVQIAAKQRRKDRGKLVRDGRPLTAKGLAMMTGFPELAFTNALTFFCDPEQGWLELEEQPSTPASPAASANPEGAPGATAHEASSSTAFRTGSDTSESNGSTGQDRTGQDRTGQDKETTSPASPSEGQRFVLWFVELLGTTGAKPVLTPSTKESWADCYDKMLRIDGRTKEQIKEVCRWARDDQFWRKNFLSPMKLREKKDGITYFDQFVARMGSGNGSSKPMRFSLEGAPTPT